jgi:hypothetical protein
MENRGAESAAQKKQFTAQSPYSDAGTMQGDNVNVGPDKTLPKLRVIFYASYGMPEARLWHVVDQVYEAVFQSAGHQMVYDMQYERARVMDHFSYLFTIREAAKGSPWPSA